MTWQETVGSVALIYFFAVSAGVVFLYSLVPWWRSALGRVMMTKAAAILSMALFAIIFTILWREPDPGSVDYEARERVRLAGRMIMYVLIAGGQTGVLVYMWRLRYRDDGSRRNPMRARNGVGSDS